MNITLPASAPPPSKVPLRYGFVLFHGFQALDVFGPLDALNSLSTIYPSLELYIIAESLEPVSTRVPPSLLSSTTSSNPSPFAQSILPTHTFSSPPPHPLDVLIVPGGFGTRFPALMRPCIAYIDAVYKEKTLKYLLTVCTGSILVACAQSVVLGGAGGDRGEGKVRMTSNKRALAFFSERIATLPEEAQHLVRDHVEWVRKARWVVHDPHASSSSKTEGASSSAEGAIGVGAPIWSASGVSAGIDMLFAFMASVFGEETSRLVADYMEYERHLDPEWDPYAGIYGLV